MASTAPSTADQVVTIKVFYDGTTRRAKMTLRDMTPAALEPQIRTFLLLPASLKITMERYSDSAATYVVLDSSNVGVYKQLYRAAKAKSKLKLRVTVDEPKAPPQPASVEDESEQSPPSSTPEVDVSSQEPEPVPSSENKPLAATSSVPELPQIDCATSSMPLWFETDASAKPTETSPPVDVRAVPSQETLIDLQPTPYCPPGGPEYPRTSETTLVPKPAPAQKPVAKRPASYVRGFAICCNNCEKTIPDAHYHCATCDDGDFDLCQSCVDKGVVCRSDLHWLIKRSLFNGQIVNSRTEVISPKPKAKKPDVTKAPMRPVRPLAPSPRASPFTTFNIRPDSSAPPPYREGNTVHPKVSQLSLRPKLAYGLTRTCNCCVEERPESDFLHCADCEDYDLCQRCFQRGSHGHHPKHRFAAAVAGTQLPDHIKVKMGAGRNQAHNAICDGCDKYITGVRHKCLDCPDWDYCDSCVVNASFVHAKHRFVPIYEPLRDTIDCMMAQPVHAGICCDGPLCSTGKTYPSYIRGIRYKCAICHDVDFCANCEANPSNGHNKTHPLIKFKTPVRNVNVTTCGEHLDGQPMPVMGDKNMTTSRATETQSIPQTSSINKVQTVVDVKPVEISRPLRVVNVTPSPKPEEKPASDETQLDAVFVRDTVKDGSTLPPNHVFSQTWTMWNTGTVAWPAGSVIRFVGGDYMGRVDSAHAAPVSELSLASESTRCTAEVAPGAHFSFTVPLRTPARPGRFASYWRLTAPSGYKFGHRIWCDINVRDIKIEAPTQAKEQPQPEVVQAEPKQEPKQEQIKEQVKVEQPKEEMSLKGSTMIFPKLEKESPETSMYEEASEQKTNGSDLEDCDDDESWDASDDGFLTDEEYDILDASDEEFLEQQSKASSRK
jgi:next-to-BRCA1 protein 1